MGGVVIVRSGGSKKVTGGVRSGFLGSGQKVVMLLLSWLTLLLEIDAAISDYLTFFSADDGWVDGLLTGVESGCAKPYVHKISETDSRLSIRLHRGIHHRGLFGSDCQ